MACYRSGVSVKEVGFCASILILLKFLLGLNDFNSFLFLLNLILAHSYLLFYWFLLTLQSPRGLHFTFRHYTLLLNFFFNLLFVCRCTMSTCYVLVQVLPTHKLSAAQLEWTQYQIIFLPCETAFICFLLDWHYLFLYLQFTARFFIGRVTLIFISVHTFLFITVLVIVILLILLVFLN